VPIVWKSDPLCFPQATLQLIL